MSFIKKFNSYLPEVTKPSQKRLSFREKLKWTGLILILFFVLGVIPLFGLGTNALANFEFLSYILGASFGSVISLGIGPIVTASIVLQLLNGAGLLRYDLTTANGKADFHTTQRFLTLFFILFEAAIYVFMGGLSPNPELIGTSLYFSLQLLLVFQLCLGGLLILYMDEVVSKWGFGSGISLFIAAGVSKSIFIRTFSWLPANEVIADFTYSTGKLIQLFQAFSVGEPRVAFLALAAIISTVAIFAISVYLQAMKIEIPLSFGRIRGHGVRWPLSFTYANVIPVILVSALIANLQLTTGLLNKWGIYWLGTVSATGTPQSGLISWIVQPGSGGEGLLGMIINSGTLSIGIKPYIQGLIYLSIMVGGCMLFSYFWVQTSGMDARTQAKNMMASGLTIPGFRRDQRVLERLLDRYIGPLTLMGGAAIGFLAAFADLMGALGQGTGILLTVMIIYRLYEEIAKQHMMDMHPMMRRFME